jgi:hypothetical protein
MAMHFIQFLALSVYLNISLGTNGRLLPQQCEGHYDKSSKMIVYSIAEEQPKFPGGSQEFYKFLGKELDLTNEEWEDTGMYIMLTFIIDKKGKCTYYTISNNATNIGKVKGKVQRLFEKMPTWTPGKCNGKPVAVKYNLPLRR